MSERIDIGHGHFTTGTCWAPERDINPHVAHLPDVDDWGLTIEHPDGKGGTCMSAVTFDGPVQRQLAPDNARWNVESKPGEPLTLSPSILCRRCGDHGFIRQGKWVPA